MAEAIARFKPGVNVPGFCATAVLAGRFVKIVGDKTTDGDYQIGQCTVAGESRSASPRPTPPRRPTRRLERRAARQRRPAGAIARVKPGGAIAAWGPVKTDASGQAIAQGGTGNILGYACHTVAGTEALVEIALV
jgi:hypothetical protein